MQVSDLEIGQKVYIDTGRGKIEGTYMGMAGEDPVIVFSSEKRLGLMTYRDAGFEPVENKMDYYPLNRNIERLFYGASGRKRKELSAWLGGCC